MVEMTREDRLRRVLILCVHFSRNLAYHEAGDVWRGKAQSDFWLTVDGNFLDLAVLEWCKLFGDRKGNHYWNKVVSKCSCFKAGLLSDLGAQDNEFNEYIRKICSYRDKFIAHLDNRKCMDFPELGKARKAVEFYHGYILTHEADGFDLDPWDLRSWSFNLHSYFECCKAEAEAIFDRCHGS